MLKLIGLSAAMVFMATSANAQIAAKPLPEGRPCLYEDVVGVWKSRVVNAAEQGVENVAASFPRDYMRFKPDGEMMYFASNREITDLAAVHAQMDEIDRLDNTSYRATMISPGVLILWQGENPFQGFTCTAVDPREGKTTTIFSELEGMPALHRIQTKLD